MDTEILSTFEVYYSEYCEYSDINKDEIYDYESKIDSLITETNARSVHDKREQLYSYMCMCGFMCAANDDCQIENFHVDRKRHMHDITEMSPPPVKMKSKPWQHTVVNDFLHPRARAWHSSVASA